MAHGAARGADSIADHVVHEHFPDVEIIPFPAAWVTYGKAAGIVRNDHMVRGFEPDFVLAFLEMSAANGGTSDLITRAANFGIPTKIIRSNGEIVWRQGFLPTECFDYWLVPDSYFS